MTDGRYRLEKRNIRTTVGMQDAGAELGRLSQRIESCGYLACLRRGCAENG